MPRAVEFPHHQAQWDQYRRFHKVRYGGSLVQFDTGELMIRRWDYKPGERGLVNDFGYTVVMPHDNSNKLRKLVNVRGEPVLRAWLRTGQTLLIDVDTHQVISLLPWNATGTEKDHRIPQNIAQWAPYAYCSGFKRPWVSPTKISYRLPVKLDKAQRKQLREVLLIVKAQDRLGVFYDKGHPEWPRYGDHLEVIGDDMVRKSYVTSYMRPVSYKLALYVPVERMTVFERSTLARNGYLPLYDHFTDDELRLV